ncbi:uncharacterized protein LOC126661526 [Mercurialis annua]|uniref:uncharacterized protein LOC126661526 n=1 Tax=Mercurialis annua TaxID=3986 RepID=UPI0024AF814F|nr:uncharacterized protein LOC126661526 [Mercurialis annua]
MTYALPWPFSRSIHFPNSILELVILFAFIEEFLFYYLQRKDTSGIENKYFDLILVPISICVVSRVLELKCESNHARMARGMGWLILQETWFVRMGISFYSDMIVHGCALHEKSRGDYTVKCRGHPEYHRARGIATLQFNCHLALDLKLPETEVLKENIYLIKRKLKENNYLIKRKLEI